MSKLDDILDKLADYLPDECASLNHNDLPETKQQVKDLIRELIGECRELSITDMELFEHQSKGEELPVINAYLLRQKVNEL